MPFSLILRDITTLEVDVIVNAANTDLRRGGGVCGAIFKAANSADLQAECDKLAPIKTGEAVITGAYNLKAKHIIHTAGPIYNQQSPEESQELLALCYINSLELARKNGCKSIAFPVISSGIYGYPKEEALKVAKQVIEIYLDQFDMDVYVAVFG